jgi:cytochrome d ubiquinol oxidase subunit I
VPGVLSFMATGHWDGTVEGINDIQTAEQQRFGPGDYRPNIPVTYWTFRLMIGFGLLAALLAAVVLRARERAYRTAAEPATS